MVMALLGDCCAAAAHPDHEGAVVAAARSVLGAMDDESGSWSGCQTLVTPETIQQTATHSYAEQFLSGNQLQWTPQQWCSMLELCAACNALGAFEVWLASDSRPQCFDHVLKHEVEPYLRNLIVALEDSSQRSVPCECSSDGQYVCTRCKYNRIDSFSHLISCRTMLKICRETRTAAQPPHAQ